MFKVKSMLEGGRRLRNDVGQMTNDGCYISNYKRVKVLVFDKFKSFINIKNNKEYTLLFDEVINATNSSSKQEMSLYTDGKKLYVRDNSEFEEKFKEGECLN